MLQPNKPKKGKKKVAAAPLAAKKVEPKKVVNPLFEKRPKNFGIGTLAFLYFILYASTLVIVSLCFCSCCTIIFLAAYTSSRLGCVTSRPLSYAYKVLPDVYSV